MMVMMMRMLMIRMADFDDDDATTIRSCLDYDGDDDGQWILAMIDATHNICALSTI